MKRVFETASRGHLCESTALLLVISWKKLPMNLMCCVVCIEYWGQVISECCSGDIVSQSWPSAIQSIRGLIHTSVHLLTYGLVYLHKQSVGR